jgi:hypothetical protein
MIEIEKTKVEGSVALENLRLAAENTDNIFSTAMRLLPAIKDDLQSSVGAVTSMLSDVNLPELSKFSVLATGFLKTSFKESDLEKFSKVFISVPEGFMGNILTYTGDLEESLKFYETQTAPFIKEFYITVSAFVTNKDRKLSIKDDTSKYSRLEKERTTLEKVISKSFNTGNVGRVVFSEPYNSVGEFNQTMANVAKLVKKIESYKLDAITKQVKQIVDVLDIAIRSAKNGDYTNASKESLMNLANGTFELAKQLEFISVTIYRVKALQFAVKETEAKLRKA